MDYQNAATGGEAGVSGFFWFQCAGKLGEGGGIERRVARRKVEDKEGGEGGGKEDKRGVGEITCQASFLG